jgi:hypothetical protein
MERDHNCKVRSKLGQPALAKPSPELGLGEGRGLWQPRPFLLPLFTGVRAR